ncbi:MAG: S49 family peptidase [Alphaproteobacteria bacterium]|nr:S49 family peptidase [Alphaproteobacteria bacterium]
MTYDDPVTRARTWLTGVRLPWSRPSAPRVNVVRLAGAIGGLGPMRRGLTLAGVEPVLERAFGAGHPVAVALVINSPGGSAVQSALIAGRIRALADERKVPVFAFAEDVAASGGYWLASAADEIHADASSIVGSIGVIAAGFGFQGALERLGVERRLHATGPRKGMLDPFRPESDADVARLRALQDDIFASFKAQVRARRGAKLKADDAVLFDGGVWTGREALALGLIDGLGDPRTVMRVRFGDKVRLRSVGARPSRLRRIMPWAGSAEDRAAAWTLGTLAAVEEWALWRRFGL